MIGKYEGMDSGTEVQQIQTITNQMLRGLRKDFKAAIAHTILSPMVALLALVKRYGRFNSMYFLQHACMQFCLKWLSSYAGLRFSSVSQILVL